MQHAPPKAQQQQQQQHARPDKAGQQQAQHSAPVKGDEVQRQATPPKQPPEQQQPPSLSTGSPMDTKEQALQLAGNKRQWHCAALQQPSGRLAKIAAQI